MCTLTTKRKREEDELSILFLEGVHDFLDDGYDEAEDAANIDLAADAFSSDEEEDDEHAVCSCSFSGVFRRNFPCRSDSNSI